MNKLLVQFSEWWRGWTNDDLAFALRKTENLQPGGYVAMTDAEFRAHIAFTRANAA